MRRTYPELHMKSQKLPRKARNRVEETIKRRTHRVRRRDQAVLLKPQAVLDPEEDIEIPFPGKRILKGVSINNPKKIAANTPFLRRRLKAAA